jgi:hypothetical protein
VHSIPSAQNSEFTILFGLLPRQPREVYLRGVTSGSSEGR